LINHNDDAAKAFDTFRQNFYQSKGRGASKLFVSVQFSVKQQKARMSTFDPVVSFVAPSRGLRIKKNHAAGAHMME